MDTRHQSVREPKVILNIGAGREYQVEQQFPDATCIRLDLNPAVSPHVIADARELPFAEESVDWIYANHVLEHMPYPDVGDALKEWVRVVHPRGLVRIAVPDLGAVADRIATGEMNITIQAIIYGTQVEPSGTFDSPQKPEFASHRSGFTMPMLVHLMQAVGLEVVEAERGRFGIGVKLPNGELSIEQAKELRVIGVKRDEEAHTRGTNPAG